MLCRSIFVQVDCSLLVSFRLELALLMQFLAPDGQIILLFMKIDTKIEHLMKSNNLVLSKQFGPVHFVP